MTTASPSKPVRWLAGTVGAAAVLAGGLPLLTPERFDWIGAAIGLAGATIAGFVGKYTEGQVTPVENVEVRRIPGATAEAPVQLVAAEGSEIPTGMPVDVTPTARANWPHK